MLTWLLSVLLASIIFVTVNLTLTLAIVVVVVKTGLYSKLVMKMTNDMIKDFTAKEI